MRNKFKGITLVESLIYLALFGVFFLTVMQFLFYLQNFTNNAESRLLLNQNSIFISEHLKETFKNAKSIDTINSQLDQDLGKIRIQNNDNTYVEYLVNQNRIDFKDNLGNLIPLSQTKIGINKLNFQTITDQGGSKIISVRVILELYAKDKPEVNRLIEALYPL